MTFDLTQTRILVLGASGQVGQSFRKLLDGFANVAFAERNPSDPKTKKCDLSNHSELEALILEIRPDVVLNCAAYTAVDLAEKEVDRARAINGEALGVIGKACETIGATLVHYSTDYVYAGTGTSAHRETDATAPVNAYGASKLAGEIAALRSCSRTYIFRTQWVYDRGGKNFVNTMLRFGKEREEMSVVGDQIGAPTSSDVIARYTLKALQKILTNGMPSGVYHLACRGEVSWHDFAEEIFRLARERGDVVQVKTLKKIRTEDFPTPAKRPRNSRLSLQKLESALGTALPDWKAALQEMMHQS